MKILGIVGLILAIIGIVIGLYCQFEILPNFNALDGKFDLSEIERVSWSSYADQKFVFGSVALFLGAIASVIGLIVGIKKHKIGWIAMVLGLTSFLLGAAQSTHVFS